MSWKRIVLIGFGGLVLLAIVVSFFRGGDDGSRTMAFSDLVAAARAGKVESLKVRSDTATAHLRNDSDSYRVNIGKTADVAKVLQDNGVTIGGGSPSSVQISYERASGTGTGSR